MKHSRILRLASVVLCAAVIVLAGVSASAGSVNSVMNDAGSNGSNGMSGMMNDIEDGINDVNDMFDDRTLGDRDGDGFIENDLIDGGMSGSSSSSSSSSSSGESGMGKSTDAPDGVLNTTGRDGVDPISEGGSNAGSNGTNTEDNGVSWIGVIIAVLLAGALVAVVIALIPKRERD